MAGETTTSKRFTVNHVFYEETLEDLVSRGINFKIVEYHLYNYSIFDLMPVDVDSDDNLFRLREDIMEVVEDAVINAKFTKRVKKLDVVLAEKNGSYHRCIVCDFTCDREYTAVYWIDVGGRDNVLTSSLKPVNKTIMSYPRLAYTVILDDMFVTSNFILMIEYQEAMEKLRRTEFSVEFRGPNELGGNLYCPKKVKLFYKDSGRVIDLKEEIKKLEKWEWEMFSNLSGDDSEICEKGKFRVGRASKISLDRPVLPLPLKETDDQFSATVSRVVADEQNPKMANLHIVLLNHCLYINNFKVLNHQLERYCNNIKRSAFFPALNEALLFKLADKEKYRVSKYLLLGKWMRAIRNCQEGVYLLDFDNSIDFTALPKEDYEMRPLYDEFLKVPFLRINVRPANENGVLSLAEAEKSFKIGSRYTFKVTKQHNRLPCEVSFGPAAKHEKNLTIANFLGIQ